MLFELVDTLQKKRRLLFAVLFVLADVWLLIICTQTLQAHRSNITAHIHNTEDSQASLVYQSDSLSATDMSAGIEHVVGSVEIGVLRTVVSATDSITTVEHGLAGAGQVALHSMDVAMAASLHLAGEAFAFVGHTIAFPFVITSRCVTYISGGVSHLANNNLVSVIQPKQDKAIPVITPEQAQQASLIQSGTLDFEPVKPVGSGGACDVGAGNGGYPMVWCDAPMDTVQTISYSSDHINRECTSYAYWYFTTVEGHTDFHVTGNANRWARTSNYPTRKTPVVGAIAVETAGYYGHVAIVQALPGQLFEGKTVPTGYVLVSEMNYDWYGHFRYSYSPLTKFSAYIRP